MNSPVGQPRSPLVGQPRGPIVGSPTRGTTGYNRLRRSDRWLVHSPRVRTVLRTAAEPLVVDLGYGALPVTTVELASRLRTVRADVRVVGLEIHPERVRLARELAGDIVEFGLGASSAVSFTKSLGPDFTLYGRRELTNPLPGVRQLWELELAYRPRRFGRFGIVFGADQDHPIRISFEYGFRF